MRATTDLFDIDLVFSQRAPLTTEGFINECKRRESRSREALSSFHQLEALHQAGVLIPMYRFVKEVDSILEEARRQKISELSVLFHLSDEAILSQYLDGHTEVASPKDPRSEAYEPWPNYIRTLHGQLLWASAFFYSPYQLLLAPTLRKAIPKMQAHRIPRQYSDRDISFSLTLGDKERTSIQEKVDENVELVVVLTALETAYFPWITGHMTNHRSDDLDVVLSYRQSFDPVSMLNWMGWEPERIRDRAERLLIFADGIDPISDWSELVRLAHPDKWEKLRGDALVAMDYRMAAEMLLRFYEDLEEAKAAPPLEPVPRRFYAPRRNRLKANPDELDAALMDFGLSPYPSLLLILEGETEMIAVRRVMEVLNVPTHRSFIRLFNMGGVCNRLGLLASYIAVPELGDAVGNGAVLKRPPTHFLLAIDPEGPFTTEEQREAERKNLVKLILNALPKAQQTSALSEDLDSLVTVETWDEQGQSFEFAHFSDDEIAGAILGIYKGSSTISPDKLVEEIKEFRRNAIEAKRTKCPGKSAIRSANLKKVWQNWNDPKPQKPELIDALWPLLKKKIQDALPLNELKSIPVARVVSYAYECAAKSPRRNVMIRK